MDKRSGFEEQDSAACENERHIVKVYSCKIPSFMYEMEPHFEEAGFELGPEVPGEKGMRYANIPPGWKFRKTSPNGLAILDESGNERVHIFTGSTLRLACILRRLVEINSINHTNSAVVYDSKKKQLVYVPSRTGWRGSMQCQDYIKAHSSQSIAKDWDRE